MSNFKNAKEFDRDPLRKSDIYKKLKPTSGKSLGERWKDRRKSENISKFDWEDDPIGKIIKAEQKTMKQDPDLPHDGPIPPPRPRVNTEEKKSRPKPKSKTNPNSKSDRLNSQVTPGKWITK